MNNRVEVEKKWAQEKYKVMMHSQKYYDLIRQKLKIELTLEQLDNLLYDAYQITPSVGSVVNAYHHMWGYFKKICTEDERETAKLLERQFREKELDYHSLLEFITELADKYEIEYLQKSSVLYPYQSD